MNCLQHFLWACNQIGVYTCMCSRTFSFCTVAYNYIVVPDCQCSSVFCYMMALKRRDDNCPIQVPIGCRKKLSEDEKVQPLTVGVAAVVVKTTLSNRSRESSHCTQKRPAGENTRRNVCQQAVRTRARAARKVNTSQQQTQKRWKFWQSRTHRGTLS